MVVYENITTFLLTLPAVESINISSRVKKIKGRENNFRVVRFLLILVLKYY